MVPQRVQAQLLALRNHVELRAHLRLFRDPLCDPVKRQLCHRAFGLDDDHHLKPLGVAVDRRPVRMAQ